MAQKNRANMLTDIVSNIYNNLINFITGQNAQDRFVNLLDSSPNILSDASQPNGYVSTDANNEMFSSYYDEEISRADLITDLTANLAVGGKFYRINDAVGSTITLLVIAESNLNLYPFGIDATTGEVGVYDITTDVFAPIVSSSQTLAQTLVLGNTSGANDIEFDATQGLFFANTSRLREGTIDAGLGGTKGIAQICAVGYELKWEAGRLYVMDGNGLFIRQSLYNFTTTPTVTDDTTKGYMVGSLWTLDDGTVYVCSDATLGAAVWAIGGIPNLQQVTNVGFTTTTKIASSNGAGSETVLNNGNIDIATGDETVTIEASLATYAYNAQLPNKLSSPQTFAMLSDITSGGLTKATAAGTDTYTATISGVASYTDGDAYLVRFTNGNTTAATLNINSLGAKSLYRNNDGAIIGGDIWDDGEMLCVYNSTLNAFQCIGTSPNSIFAYVTNDDSVTITKGQVVYAFGGTGDRMTVKLANNTSDATSARTVGVVLSASIAANQKGIIILQGLLDGLNILPTSTYADGDSIYLGATAGSITNVKPYAPNHLVYIATVTTASNGSAGRMYVKIQNGYELDELHNVQAQSPTLKDTLWYDNTVSPAQWKTASIATISGLKAPISSVGNGTAVTGVVVNTYSKGLLIPANSRGANDVVQVDFQVTKTGAAGNVQLRFYWNTTNDLSGSPILLGTSPNGAALWLAFSRLLSIEVANGTGNATKVAPTSITTLATGYGTSTTTTSTVAIDWTANGYLICSILNSNAADSSVCNMLKLN